MSQARDPAGAVFVALSDPTRRDLLATIAEHPATTATELASRLPISRQAVVKHLGTLTDAGLLERVAAGREVRYRVTPAPLSDAVSWMAEVGGQWDERLAALGRMFGAPPAGPGAAHPSASPTAAGPRAPAGPDAAHPSASPTAARPAPTRRSAPQRGEMPK